MKQPELNFTSPSVHTVRIEFDGGTPCNDPKRGFGLGYGSYRIGNGSIVRIQFTEPMSNNVAEITTLLTAIRVVQKGHSPAFTMLEIHGDSQIALNRCTKGFTKNQRGKIRNSAFAKACDALRLTCAEFAHVYTHWRGREASVKLFGH